MYRSIHQYAKERNICHTAVIKAIKQGLISQEPDGTIDAIRADRHWLVNTTLLPITALLTILYKDGQAPDDVPKADCKPNSSQNKSGKFISRDQAHRQLTAFVAQEHEIWRCWPARVVTSIANQLDVNIDTLLWLLEYHVDDQLRWLNKRNINFDEQQGV